MEQVMFSIIVPVYNVQQYLVQCLDSLLAQTYQNFEIIIVDDKSTDSSLTIAREYANNCPDQIRLLEHSVNKGLGGARNTGIEAAAGQYLLFVDSDDFLIPDALEKLSAFLYREDADVVEFCFQYVDEDGKYLCKKYCTPSIYTQSGEERSLLTRTVTACNKAIRRDIFLSHGIRFPEKRYYEDYWTIPKLWMVGCTVSSLDEALYCYRQRSGSIMHDTNVEKANDVLLGADGLLAFCRSSGFPKARWNELEYLIIRNLLAASVRINGIDPHTPMQKKIRDYWLANFPDYQQNPYLESLDPLHKRLLRLIIQGKNLNLYVTFHCRARIVGFIKGILKKSGLKKFTD